LRSDDQLVVEEILPQTRSPEEFARLVQTQIEAHAPDLVVIDGIEGYRTAIKGGEEDVDLRQRLHSLTRYLINMNVTVIVVDERHEVTGLPRPTGSNISYLADNLIFQQYLELDGELHRVVGVLKKRVSGFETVPRRYRITGDGIEIGERLTDVHGVLDGIPERDDGPSSRP
jgi:circadian clock protein KaiC